MKQNKMQIPEGYKNSALGIIPNDWEVKRLGDIFIFKNGINASKKDYGQGVKFVNTMDVLNNDSINVDKLLGSVMINKKQELDFILSYGDVLFNRTSETRNEVGCSSVFLDTRDAVFGGFIIRAQSLGKQLYEMYKKHCFKANYVRDQITAFGNGAIRYNIGQEDLSKVLISIPPLPQQQKIAEILGTWDEAIEKQSKLIDKLTDRKRGLMQQLLTGRKRLAGFSEEWKEVRLGELGETVTGNTPDMTRTEYYGGEYNWVTAVDIKQMYIKKTNIRLSELGISVARMVPRGSVLVTCIASIGKNTICEVDSAFNQQINAIIPNKDNLSEFIYFKIENSVNLLKSFAGLGAVPIINKSTFNNIKIQVPSLPEQTAIANILTAADKEIELAKSKLELLRSQKSGLMQQLLTGKIRVKIVSHKILKT